MQQEGLRIDVERDFPLREEDTRAEVETWSGGVGLGTGPVLPGRQGGGLNAFSRAQSPFSKC